MVTLPLGEGSIQVALPDCEVDIAEPPGGTVVDPRDAARRALAHPHGPDLQERAVDAETACIVVTDVTRSTPDGVLVDELLSVLRAAGIEREAVTVVVGLGLHRPMTDAELAELLGEHADLAVNHDPDATVRVGEIDGVPVELHERATEADLLVSTGMVEPHQYAGFSGGAKTAVIGAGSEAIVQYTHGPEMLSRDGVRLGRVDTNPFRDAVDRAGDVAGVDFCLNVTHGPAGILDAAAGAHRAVVRDLAGTARDALSVAVDGGYDVVLAGVGAPKDANLYQVTRAFTYVVLGTTNPLRPGGRVVVPARLGEGAGEGTGERRFYTRLSSADSATALYDEMCEGYDPGAQRAFVVARALREHDLYVTDSEAPAVVEECLLEARDSVADAVPSGARVLVVRDALNTLLE